MIVGEISLVGGVSRLPIILLALRKSLVRRPALAARGRLEALGDTDVVETAQDLDKQSLAKPHRILTGKLHT